MGSHRKVRTQMTPLLCYVLRVISTSFRLVYFVEELKQVPAVFKDTDLSFSLNTLTNCAVQALKVNGTYLTSLLFISVVPGQWAI